MRLKFDTRPYWSVVEDCLVELHGVDRSEARKRIKALLAWIASPPDGVDGEIVYHDEQFDVACDLAGNELRYELYQDQYDQIVERYYPSWRTGMVVRAKPD